MSQFIEIIEGWKNLVFKNKESEELAKKRLDICLNCPRYIKATKTCSICRCFIPSKVRSETAVCPSRKW